MNFIETIKHLNDYMGVILGFLVVLLGIIENSSKIAQKPLTMIAKWFGFGKDDRIEQIHKEVSRLNEKVDRNDIRALKHRVLGIDLMIREGNADKISDSQFKTAIEDLDKYNEYHDTYKDLNGELKNAEKNIWEAYNHINGR